ncbi:hypothetical protein [Streptomyces gardneri]|uniref:Uncharacterized protein n=1 Tax=Streptomyces gardneri TaxID=66892 RepID=A0A4Y3RL44_9ACTN|nr:hypothetical protein [Streptomyces gardneri]GEB58561.1 hypothetical protein SGA01_41660 [Streptomyces gardneri]GHH06269.1 hypothetical protein GCM10017674_46370 [Streptomyces gardneri]
MSRTTNTCPGCDRDDRVQAVPAVYLAGRDAVTSRERNRDGDMRTVTRTVTTGLSDALAPVPEEPAHRIGCVGLLAGFVCIASFMAWVFVGGALEDDQAPEADFGAFGPPPAELGPDLWFTGWLSAVALAVALLVVLELRRRRTAFAHLTRGRHRAEELWSCGWYCHRCGTVHFEDIPGEDRTPLTLQRFRERVWEHGGYGDLAAEQRAVDSDRS